ncbi:MAG: hypothetical protein ACLP19_28415 [Xanthobacteraceae bacterium]
MIEQVERVVAIAEKTAAAEEAKALDLVASPDGDKARAAVDEVAWACKRLRAQLPKLHQQYAAAYAKESQARWDAEHARIKALVEAEAKRFAECREYMQLVADRFAAAKAIEKEVVQFNISSPPGMHIDGVELTARNLQSFSTHAPSVVDKTVLQTWEPGGRSLWPPPRVIDPAMFGPVPLHDVKYSDHWWENSQARQQILLERAEQANR